MAKFIDFSDVVGDDKKEGKENKKTGKADVKAVEPKKKHSLPMPLMLTVIKKCGGFVFSRNKKQKKGIVAKGFGLAKKTAKATYSATKKVTKFCIRKAKNVNKTKMAGVLNNYAKKMHNMQNSQKNKSDAKDKQSTPLTARDNADYTKLSHADQPGYYKKTMRPERGEGQPVGYWDARKAVSLKKPNAQKNTEKTQKNTQKDENNRNFTQKASLVVQKLLPFAVALLPGGVATAIAINRYNARTEAFNQMNIEIANAEATKSARESFINAINEIDAQKWLTADNDAYQSAQTAYDEYLNAHPSDQSGAQTIFDSTYTSNLCSGLELTPEQYEGYLSLHDPLAMECEKNIDYWINYGWQSMGYADEMDALEKNPELLEGFMNNEEWANNAWSEMVEQASTSYLNAGIFDVMKTQATGFANENIFALGEATLVTVEEYASTHPGIAAIGALGAFGVGVLAFAMTSSSIQSHNERKALENAEEKTVEAEVVEFRHLK